MTAVDTLYGGTHIILREVGLRDGLQMVSSFPSTSGKRKWLASDHSAGIRHFEVGSFVPVSSFPQFADVDQMIAEVAALPNARSSALVLNDKGGERALASDVDEIVCVVSASEEHNQRNARRSRESSLAEIGNLLAGRGRRRDVVVTVAIAMSFGCSIAGKDAIAPADVISIAERALADGADAISIADTVGYAAPTDVTELVKSFRGAFGDVPLMCHFHDTRGLGLANAAAALDAGVRVLDASLGGLGGCPFAPRATGNVVLEDLVFLCRSMGFDVPVDPEALVRGRAILTSEMRRKARRRIGQGRSAPDATISRIDDLYMTPPQTLRRKRAW